MSVRSPESTQETAYDELRNALEAVFVAKEQPGDTASVPAQTRSGVIRDRRLQNDGSRLSLERTTGDDGPTFKAAITDPDGLMVRSYVYPPDAPRAADTQREMGDSHCTRMLAVLAVTYFEE